MYSTVKKIHNRKNSQCNYYTGQNGATDPYLSTTFPKNEKKERERKGNRKERIDLYYQVLKI